MENREFAEGILEKQKETLNDIENLIKLLDEDEILRKNEELKNKLDLYTDENLKLMDTVANVQDENLKLRLALNEQIISEKLNILKISKVKMETYFQARYSESENRLKNMESQLKSMVQQSESRLRKEMSSDESQLLTELNRVNDLIKVKIEERKKQIEAERNLNLGEIESKFRELQDEEVDQDTVQRRLRQNNFEINLGLSWLNKLGILLILLGVATAIKFGYAWFNPHLKGIFSFIIGIVFLLGGEFMMRKQKNTFAMGISSGGVAILYFATFSGYFFLNILSMNGAIILSLLVTMVTIALSLRYNSKTICIFSLIGGYLPFFSYVFAIGLESPGIYVAMAYVFLLNTMVLIISLYKKWQIVNYIAFLINFPVFIYLINISESNIASLLFNSAVFALFLFIVLTYSLRQKVSLNAYDLILLGVNTTVSCAAACVIFAGAGWNDYLGLLALFFALFYYALGRAIDAIMGQEKTIKGFFYLTAITFAVLMIPFQFDIKWMTIGWTIEAVLMIIWGLRNKVELLEAMGWIVLLLSFGVFHLSIQLHETVYHFKYALITAGMLIAIVAYLKNTSGSIVNRFPALKTVLLLLKYFIIYNTFIYLLSETSYLYRNYLVDLFKISPGLISFYAAIIKAAVMVSVAAGLIKIKILQDRIVGYMALFLILLFDVQCVVITFHPLLNPDSQSADWVAFVFLLLYHLAVFANIRWAVLRYISNLKYNLEFYPLSQALYLVLALTMILSVQFQWLSHIRFVISLSNLVLAFCFIYYGISRRYIYIRRMGLILAILASAKLFLIDLADLTTLGRIIAYFAFGLILLGISYLYQKMEKTMKTVNTNTAASGEGEIE